HGMKGDKQDNMVETDDEQSTEHGIPVFSLYGRVRRPSDAMLDTFDVILVDMQDLGTRVYTFITTLLYVMEGCARRGKAVWMLEGTTLSEGRGTTRPLEGVGAPDLDPAPLLDEMRRLAPDWLAGCRIRPWHFEPTFHKHAGRLCHGFQLHVDDAGYQPARFRP